jgi:hypothetical protein
MRKDDRTVYGLDPFGEYEGNKMAKCLVQLEFPKVNMNEEWFGEYELYHGARVYPNAQSTDFVELPGAYTNQTFDRPQYTDPDLVKEIENTDNIHKYEVINERRDFDAGAALNQGSAMGIQEIVGTFYINPDPNAEQKLEIKTKTFIPIAFGEQMKDYTIYTHLTFKNQQDYKADPAKVVCRTVVGDKYARSVTQYDKDTNFSEEKSRMNW